MARRDRTPEKTGKKSMNAKKSRCSGPPMEPIKRRPGDTSSMPEEGDCRPNPMTPIERIFIEEIGREMGPEERRILLGVRRAPGKSK